MRPPIAVFRVEDAHPCSTNSVRLLRSNHVGDATGIRGDCRRRANIPFLLLSRHVQPFRCETMDISAHASHFVVNCWTSLERKRVCASPLITVAYALLQHLRSIYVALFRHPAVQPKCVYRYIYMCVVRSWRKILIGFMYIFVTYHFILEILL